MKMDLKTEKKDVSEKSLAESEGSSSASKTRGKTTEKKRRKPSDLQFANIIEKINEGFVGLDAQMNYIYINQRGSELLKRKPEDLIGKNYWGEYPEDKNTSFGQAYARALETQTPIEIEDYYAPGDRWFENRIYPSEEGLSIFFNDVTERKRAEETMRESEERFQALANGSPVLLWVNGLEGCEFVNREYLDFLGLASQTDVRGYDWSGFVHPDDREAYMAAYLLAFEKQALFSAEFRFRRRDGEYRWMRSEATPRRAADGSFLGYVGATIDITIRKRAEQALREKDQQLHRITDVTPTLFSQCSRDLRYLFVNRATAELLGYPVEEIVGKPIQQIMGDSAFKVILPYVERVLKGERVEYETEIPYKTIGPRFMRVVYIPETDDKGMVVGWIATVADITERKRSEDALRTSEERLRIATQAARMFTWELDIRTRISKVADNFAEAMGFSPDLIPKDNEAILEEFIHPEDTQVILGSLTKAVQSHISQFSVQYRILNPENGQPVWLDVNGKIVYDLDGNPERMFGVAQNITESKEGENRLALLAEVSELLRTFEDPIELTFAVSKAVGEHLQVRRCLFNEIDLERDLEIVHRDYCNGAESVAGEHKVSDYSSVTSAEVAVGKTVVNTDSKTDARTAADYERSYAPQGERAYVVVPLMRENGWVGSLWVSDDVPREWSKEDVSMLETIAERTWTVIEKLRINAALSESEEKYRRIVETANEGIWEINGDTRTVFVNPRMAEMLGYTAEEMMGRSSFDFIFPEENAESESRLARAKSGIPSKSREFRFRRKDGSELWTLVTSSPQLDQQGNFIGSTAMIADMTERKRMEDERDQLLEREQAQRASVEQAKIEAEQAWVEAERELAERKLAEAALGEWADAPLPQDNRPLWLRYAVAILVTLMAVMVRVLFNPLLGDALPLVTIYGAVAFSVWYGGVGPAILSVVLGYVAITGLIIEPRHIFVLNAQSITGLALFLFSNTVVMALGETMRRAQRHAHQSAGVAIERQRQVETQLLEKQIAEQSLRQSEALYRGIARSIPGGGVYVVDKDFRYLVSEGPVTEAFGLSREVLEGHKVDEVFPKELAERMEARLQRNFAGETVDFETEHNGRIYWTQQAPMMDSLGNADNAIIMTIDITERKQTEEALRRSEERFARFMQYLPGLAWIKDVEGRYVYANAAAEKAFNTPREKLYGSTDEDVFPPEVAAQFKMNDELALRDGKGMQVVETLEHDDGILHYSLVSKFPIPGPDGDLSLIGGTAFDITERKQAEEALRESEERFRAILKQATAGIVRKDATGKFIFVNEAFCNMLGYTEAELLGKTIWQLTHQDDLEENRRLYDRAMMEGIPFKLEKRLLRKDGSIIWVDVSVSPIIDATGTPQSAVAIEVDITRRKEAEEALHQLNLQLESRVQKRTVELQTANQSLRDEITERQRAEDALYESRKRLQILSQRLVDVQEEERRAIARELHDRVGQSLSALNINLVILDNQISGHVPEQTSARLDDSMQLVAETITLVRDVMSDLRPPVLDDYGLEAALQSHVDAFKSRYGIDVRFEKPDQPLPRLGASIEMTFLRIAQEALSNVARHASAKQATLSLQQEEQSVRLIVQDNGAGITSWQDANRPGSHGLTIMRERAEAFGGDLKVSSAPENGTKVEASIPIGVGGQGDIQKEMSE